MVSRCILVLVGVAHIVECAGFSPALPLGHGQTAQASQRSTNDVHQRKSQTPTTYIERFTSLVSAIVFELF